MSRSAHDARTRLTHALCRTIIVKLISTAGTGFFYTTTRPRVAQYKLAFKKYDPVGTSRAFDICGPRALLMTAPSQCGNTFSSRKASSSERGPAPRLIDVNVQPLLPRLNPTFICLVKMPFSTQSKGRP